MRRRDEMNLPCDPKDWRAEVEWESAVPSGREAEYEKARLVLGAKFQTGILRAVLTVFQDGYRLDRALLFRGAAGLAEGRSASFVDVRDDAARALVKAGFAMHDDRGELLVA